MGMSEAEAGGSGGRPPVGFWVRVRALLPLVFGLGLFALGIYALVHVLRSANPRDIAGQMRAMPWTTLASAFGATCLGYLALIGYDWSAMRYLGKKIPARIIAIGGFLGYSFGNTIGLSVLSGGAVRYRIYSAFGLTVFEVAAVSTFVSLAFGVGVTIIGLGALALHPDALSGLLPWPTVTTRVIAGAVCLGTLSTLAWLSVSGKVLKIRSLVVAAPSPGIVFGQLAFTLADTVCAALTLYVLLPAGAPDFVTFLAVFAAAVMAGVASHVPGGVGVFESVIIASMPAAVPLDQLVAAVLLYRIIYYLVPFALALAFVALNEARLAGGVVARLMGDVSDDMQPVLRTVLPMSSPPAGPLARGTYLPLMAFVPAVRPEDADPGGSPLPGTAVAARFRAATLDDLPAALALLADDAADMPADIRPFAAAFARMQAEGANHLIVGEAGGRIVATYQIAFLTGLSVRAARRAEIDAVRVAADLRGQGLGAALIQDAEARARAAGCGLIELASSKMRADADQFYDRLGFTPTHNGYKRDLG